MNETSPQPSPDAASPLAGWRCRLASLPLPLRLWIGAGCLLALAVLLAIELRWFLHKRPLAPSGGLFFPIRRELTVKSFRQGDKRWRDDSLGWSAGTLGAEGCAVASVAMVLDFYGVSTDPQQLNWYLGAHSGYTDQGWLYWERAADLAPERIRHAYEDLPSYFLIDWNLLKGNPVIVRLRFPSGTTHFVVIAGKRGFDYLIRDPGAGARRGLYPLKELGSKIEALRFYEKLK